MLRSSLAPIFIAAVMAAAAPAQTTLPAFGDVPVYEPTCRIPLTVQDFSMPLAVSPSGDTIYIATSATAINVTEVALAAWRWAGPWVAGLTAGIYVLLLWRVRRSPRVPGAPHCRHCDYCLHGQTTPRCPECGRPADRPRLGRTPWQRLRLASCVLATTSLLAAVVWIPGSTNWINERAAWWSTELQGNVRRLGFDLSAFGRFMTRITARSPFSDQTICDRLLPGLASEMYATPDGAGLLVLSRASLLLDAETLRPVRSIAPPHFDGKTRSWEQVIGYDAEQNRVWLSATGDHGVVQVFACELGSGATCAALRLQYQVPTENKDNRLPHIFWNRRIEVTRWHDRPVVIDSPVESLEGPKLSLAATMVPFRVWTADGSNELLHEFKIKVDPWTWPVVHRDHLVAFSDEQVCWFDSLGNPAGSTVPDVAGAWLSSTFHMKPVLGPAPTLFGSLGAPGRRAMGVFDVESGRLRAALILKPDESCAAFSFSSDGYVAAIKAFDVDKKQIELLIFDLRDAQAVPAKPPESPPP